MNYCAMYVDRKRQVTELRAALRGASNMAKQRGHKDCIATMKDYEAEIGELKETQEHHLKMLDGACRILERVGYSPDDYGGRENIITCVEKLVYRLETEEDRVGRLEQENESLRLRK